MRIATYIYTYIHMYKTGFHYTALVGLELPMKIKLASNLQSCLWLKFGLKVCIKGARKIQYLSKFGLQNIS